MKVIPNLILAFILINAIPVSASNFDSDSIFCNGRIISIGDPAGEVLQNCGLPAYSTQREQQIFEQIGPGLIVANTVIIDDWTFNFGPNRFQYRLILKNGRVARIEGLDYGY